MKELVSIIVPCYNAENYVAETINSVIEQTYSNWELLVVIDGATDKSADIVKEFSEKDQRISLFEKENSGVSDTRNYGIERCTGSYIAFLDSDDVWYPTNLEEKIKLLGDPNVDFVYCDMELINESSASLGEITKGTDKDQLDHYLLWDTTVIPGPCSNLIVKRKCISEGLRFDPAFSTAADQDFSFALCSRYKGAYLPKPLWKYRVISTSMSRNIKVMEHDHIGVYRKAAKLGYFKSYWFRQRCFSNLYLILAGSWWKNGNNKLRGIYFISRSLVTYPPQLWNMIKRALNIG